MNDETLSSSNILRVMARMYDTAPYSIIRGGAGAYTMSANSYQMLLCALGQFNPCLPLPVNYFGIPVLVHGAFPDDMILLQDKKQAQEQIDAIEYFNSDEAANSIRFEP